MTRKSILLITTVFISLSLLLTNLTPEIVNSTIAPVKSAVPLILSKAQEAELLYQKTTKEERKEINEVSVPSKDENYILACQTPFDYEKAYKEANIKEKLAPFHHFLKESNTAEHRLAAILFATDDQQASKLEQLHDYIQEYPNNKLALMKVIGLCSENVEHSACSQVLFDRASQIDGDNGALWLQVANYQAAKGNTPATLEAMENVIGTTDFNDYYYDNLALFMDASKGTLDVSFTKRAITGMGYHAAITLHIRNFTKFCTATDNLANNKNQTCILLGKALEERGKNLLFNVVGIAIQDKIYQAEGNGELSTKAKARRKFFLDPVKTALHNKAGDLMLHDPKLFQFWLRNAIHYGEHKAINILIKEAISLSKNKNYNPCSNE